MIDTDDPQDRTTLIPLSQYVAPAAPTRDTLQRLLAQTRGWWPGRRADAAAPAGRPDTIAPDAGALDTVAGPPADTPAVDTLEQGLRDWPAGAGTVPRRALIALGPGDTTHPVADWAARHGHAVLDPPASDTLMTSRPDPPALTGNGPLVIPDLASWFRRHRHGLHGIRMLLDRIADTDRPVLAACNSWTWAFLAMAVDGAALWPQPLTLPACEAADLRAWFARLRARDGQQRAIVDTHTGDDILAGDAEIPVHESLAVLAARSRGIPWIAWQLWRAGLRHEQPETATTADLKAATSRFRFEPPAEPVLPEYRRDETLLILHALLIHGALRAGELSCVLPFETPRRLLHGLHDAGFLRRTDSSHWYCAPTAYPVVLGALQAAGFPTARI